MDLDRPHSTQSSDSDRQFMDDGPIAIHAVIIKDTEKE